MSSITITRVFIEALMVGICVNIDCKNSQYFNLCVEVGYTEVMPKLKCTSFIFGKICTF